MTNLYVHMQRGINKHKQKD